MSESKQSQKNTIRPGSESHRAKVNKYTHDKRYWVATAIVAVVVLTLAVFMLAKPSAKQRTASATADLAKVSKGLHAGNNSPKKTIDSLSKIDPNSLSAKDKASYYAIEGGALQNSNDYEKAIAAYKQALASSPNDRSIMELIADYAQAHGDNKTATEYYQMAITAYNAVPKEKRGNGFDDQLHYLQVQLEAVKHG